MKTIWPNGDKTSFTLFRKADEELLASLPDTTTQGKVMPQAFLVFGWVQGFEMANLGARPNYIDIDGLKTVIERGSLISEVTGRS